MDVGRCYVGAWIDVDDVYYAVPGYDTFYREHVCHSVGYPSRVLRMSAHLGGVQVDDRGSGRPVRVDGGWYIRYDGGTVDNGEP